MLSPPELRKIAQRETYPASRLRSHYLERMVPWLDKKEIIIIKGIRRSGKTHIMYQLIELLEQKNEEVFYINFDDFRLDKHLNLDLLEQLIQLRKNKQTFYFLDEIQRVPGFEKWLRTYYDQEAGIKFIIGGSNISLLTPHLATVLTGRNITFEVFPLSYEEFKEFTDQPFETYLTYGGFPEVVLEADEQKKRDTLAQYLSDILAKDILARQPVDNPRQIQALITYFLANPGVKISANRLAAQLHIHKDTAQKYLNYVIDTFLLFEVPFFSYSAKTKYIGAHASKYYLVDNGLHTISAFKKNEGTLYENLVATHLRRQGKELMYWQDGAEIDFIYDETALQVTASNEIPAREKEAFAKLPRKYHRFAKKIVTPRTGRTEEDIELVPIEEFLREK